jgi:hypothetical protein
MPAIINPEETEIAILSHLPILCTIDDKRHIAGCSEFCGMDVVHSEADRLATKPISDPVSIPVRRGFVRTTVWCAMGCFGKLG